MSDEARDIRAEWRAGNRPIRNPFPSAPEEWEPGSLTDWLIPGAVLFGDVTGPAPEGWNVKPFVARRPKDDE